MELNKVICGDCLIEMPKIADKSIDMILCDLPYGTPMTSFTFSQERVDFYYKNWKNEKNDKG